MEKYWILKSLIIKIFWKKIITEDSWFLTVSYLYRWNIYVDRQYPCEDLY